jgi:ferric-dicitrate binding protein FerR (iron transport regulator)
VRISCRTCEKRLCLYVDGLLKSDECEHVHKHVAACARCARYLHLLQQSGEVILQARAAGETFFSHDAVERFVQETTQVWYSPGSSKHLPAWPRTDRLLPRFAIVGSAGMAMLTVIATVLFLRQFDMLPGNFRTYPPVTRQLPHQAPAAPSDTSFSWLNRGCAVKTKSGSQADVLVETPRTVRLGLRSGEILIAGIEGLYDTIEVLSGTLVVRAMGTRFSVRRMNDSLDVRVLAGAVLISIDNDSIPSVEAGQGVLVNLPAQNFGRYRLDKDALDGLLSEFSFVSATPDSAMLRSSRRSSITAGISGEETSRRTANPASAPASADDLNDVMTRAEKLLSRHMWYAAIDMLNRYLEKGGPRADKAHYVIAVCFSRIGRYEDAVRSFRRAAAHTTERFRHEAALHFANRLLFRKLGDYRAAEEGISEYLTRYPDGKYVVFERHYLIEILMANGEIEAGLSLMQRYVEDYPDECPSRRYGKVLTSHRRDVIVESTLKR